MKMNEIALPEMQESQQPTVSSIRFSSGRLKLLIETCSDDASQCSLTGGQYLPGPGDNRRRVLILGTTHVGL